ncbi:MAG: phytanoyl-CoA dioxygenase family protein [Pirellulales bacterium]
MRFEHFTFVVDIYGYSPALEAMVERVLTDPVASAVLEKAVGKHFKIRGYNLRRMDGSLDPLTDGPQAVPHVWHRDWRGEFGISILLSDVPEPNNSGTCFVPGSHLWPYCPRDNTVLSTWNVLRTNKLRLLSKLMHKLSLFTNRLARRRMTDVVESTGEAGDVFYFFNDTWHGRNPNLHGRQTTVLFLGLFPTEFPFPDDVKLPPAEVLATLPPRFRQAVRHDQPVNQGRDSLAHWVLDNQQPVRWFDLFHLVRLERRLFDVLALPLTLARLMARKLKQLRARKAAPVAPTKTMYDAAPARKAA